jgi:hypothetical protein
MATALALGSDCWFFVDQTLIEAAGIALRLHAPVRPETGWTPQRPWESGATWRGEASFAALRERSVRLRVAQRDADLDALVCAPDAATDTATT